MCGQRAGILGIIAIKAHPKDGCEKSLFRHSTTDLIMCLKLSDHREGYGKRKGTWWQNDLIFGRKVGSKSDNHEKRDTFDKLG